MVLSLALSVKFIGYLLLMLVFFLGFMCSL